MNILLGLAIGFITIAILILFQISPSYLESEMQSDDTNQSLKKMTVNKKKSKLVAAYENTVLAMKTMGQTKSIYTVIFATIMLIFLGSLSGITFSNRFLSPVLAVSFALIPFIYIRVQYLAYKSLLVDEMETALSVITSSYQRRENIVLAFEENIPHINEPLKSVFEEFIFKVNHTGIETTVALEEMKHKINHAIFIDWIDELKRCHKDRNLKTSLQPVVNRITDIRIATNQAKVILYEVRNEFLVVSLLSMLFMFITYYVVPRFVGQSFQSELTHFLFAFHLLLLVVSTVRAYLLTKDVKFEV